ncbi:MAG: tryptophan--tRNA ligase [Proteobacteria bacterium]|nr:tryptophan--tRNA ligase [Pseudomonadota bacterium]
MVATATAKKTVMSGMRPTGRMHIGHYWGALKNYIELQEKYQCYFCVVDWHMLTVGYEDTSKLQDNVRDMVIDWLAVGVDPEKAVVFKQSSMGEHAELALLLGMITPLSWLENNPTWKEQLQELSKTKLSKAVEGAKGGHHADPLPQTGAGANGAGEADQSLRTHGHLGYPVLQAADILMYRAEIVPVGQDQLPHLELSREIARRFNFLYGKPGSPVLPEPQPMLTPTPKVPGLDGRKMSKSYGNGVDLYETTESLGKKVMTAYTDPKKIKRDDPGHPDPSPENPPGCSVYALHKLYSPHWEKRGEECRAGQIGCVACKKDLLASMEPAFAEFRERREKFSANKSMVDDILAAGAEKARPVARETMERVRAAMHLK